MKINGNEIVLTAGDNINIKVVNEIEKDTSVQVTDKGKLKYKVGLIGDVHFDVEDSHNSEYALDLQNACEYFHKAGCEFISAVGDFAQYNDKDYEVFKDWYDAHGYSKGLRLYTPLGNHDYLRLFTIRNSSDTYVDDNVLYNYLPMWNNVGEFHNIINPSDGKHESDINFFEHGNKWNDKQYTGWRTSKSKLNYWLERHGDIYVYVSVDYGTMILSDPWDTLARGINLLDYNNDYVKHMTDYVKDTPYDRNREKNFDYRFYDPETLIWLKELIEDNKDKRIFVFMHHFLPNKAGDTNGNYSHLRIWPVPTSMNIKQKFYSGSNTVCGLTFWFLNKLMLKHCNVVWFGGHSHYAWKEQEDKITRQYNVTQPIGNEVTPLVDDLNSLNGTEYDYGLYLPTGHSTDNCAPSIHIPSLSKPTSSSGETLYESSEGAIMEVYENGITIKCITFKYNNSRYYDNQVVKVIDV